MRRAALLLALAAGCGAPATPTRTVRGTAPEVDETAGIHLLALPRSLGRDTHTVWLSLFVDAGARDAEVPGTAVAAAWVAASEGVEGRASADWIELSAECPAPELGGCVSRLAEALATRRVEPGRWGDALSRWREARRRAATSASRASDRLALGILLGPRADPLGAGEPDAAAVESFLADHFGPRRALLVAVGEVDADRLRDAARASFADAPSAGTERADRDAPGSGIEVAVDDEPSTSVATLAESVPAAVALGRRWVARMGGGASVDVFPLREGTGLVLRSEQPPDRVVSRARELLEEPPGAGTSAPPGELARIARWEGARWAAGEHTTRGGLAVGVVVDGGRGDGLAASEAEAQLREQTRLTVQRALEDPPIDGTTTSLRVENGARIGGRRDETETRFVLSVRFDGGAVEETPRAHGTTGLLAHALTARCLERAPAELGAPPEMLGIVVETVVEPARFGWTIQGPADRWPEITYLGLRCAHARELTASLVERVRHVLPDPDAETAALAAVIAPDAPGRIWPWPGALVPASADDLSRWARRVLGARRLQIHFRGPDPEGPIARRLARGAARLEPGAPPSPREWAGPPIALGSATGSPTGAWVVYTARDREALLHAVENAAEPALEATPGVRVERRRVEEAGHRFYAALLVRAGDEALSTLPASLRPLRLPEGVVGPSFVVLRPAR
ncbi:MAG: hypothetical protein R3B82_23940 [Sandaracinaceae bacterium]